MNKWYKLISPSTETVYDQRSTIERERDSPLGPVVAGIYKSKNADEYFVYTGMMGGLDAAVKSYDGVECAPPKRSEVETDPDDPGVDEIPFAPED